MLLYFIAILTSIDGSKNVSRETFSIFIRLYRRFNQKTDDVLGLADPASSQVAVPT